MDLSQQRRTELLGRLAEAEGFVTVEAMLEAAAVDSVSPGICTGADCDGSIEVEPDQDRGWCPVCERNTVVAALVLAGII